MRKRLIPNNNRLLLVADQETAEFIIRAETQLFQFRFSCLTEEEIYKLLKSTQKHVHLSDRPTAGTYNYNNIQHVLYTLLAVKESAQTWRNVAHKYMQERGGEWFEVPFQAVVSLVAEKRVTLQEGWARVAYDDLEEVLTSMFESMLRLTLKQTREIRERALQDVRMKRLASRLKSIYRAEIPILLDWNNLTCLSHDQVDQSESFLPLCMSNLHQMLRTEHRLKHNDRIQYSLFLKEAGMPVHQAIKFWKQEYSHSSSLPGTCQHSWQKDERRYVYSIRHLYGLEGARRNYRGHCCASLQRRQLGPSEQGGCPFVHFDNHHLSNLLAANQIAKEDQTAILNLRLAGPPCGACKMYLQCKMGLHCGDTVRDCGRDEIACCEPRPQNTDAAEGTDDTDVSGEVGCESSDEDVIFVSIKTRQGSVKRRSLSTKTGVKKQILWYENGRLAGGLGTKDKSDMHVSPEENDLNKQTIIESYSCHEKRQVVVDLKSAHNSEKTGPLKSSMQRAQSNVCTNSERTSVKSSECNREVAVEVSTKTFDTCKDPHMHSVSLPNGNSLNVSEHLTANMWSKGDNSISHTSSSSMNAASVPGLTHTNSSDSDVAITEDEINMINDGVSCFEHDICPSQVESCTQAERTQKVQSLSERLKDLQIHKPIDFYTSFKEMVDGLKPINKQ